MVTQAEYEAAVRSCVVACARWKAEHPDARLSFQSLPRLPGAPAGRMPYIGTIESALEFGVAGNQDTRDLLMAISDAAPGGGASVLMAEYALERVYGIRWALTHERQ
jgi:hypothetical protein